MIATRPSEEHLARVATLTARQAEIAGMVAQGMTHAQIADELFLATNTVKGHTYRAMKHLKVDNAPHLAALVSWYDALSSLGRGGKRS